MEEPPTPAPRSDPRTRGELFVSERVAVKIVEGALSHHAPNVSGPKVRVVSLSDTAVELRVSVAVLYPTAPLTGVLAGVRQSVGPEVSRQLGRSVTRLDLTVWEFTAPPPPPRRRVE